MCSRIDDIEDEIVREKQKIQKVGNELDETFEDMFYKYWKKDYRKDNKNWKLYLLLSLWLLCL